MIKHLGVKVETKHLPELDRGFMPLGGWIDAYLRGARRPVSLAVGREDGVVSVYDTFIHGTSKMAGADWYYIERLLKLVLWLRGGTQVTLYGADEIAARLRLCYAPGGGRAFDADFMEKIYEKPLVITAAPLSQKVSPKEQSIPVGGHFNGCRIGFDAGGSDRKVSAVIDGRVVYSEEVVWHPKTAQDPEYHLNGILESFWAAAAKMPRVDAIGVSSASINSQNRVRTSSLFLKVPQELFEQKAKDIYIRAAAQFGSPPLVVANDGDVAALAGAAELGGNRLLGIAMGTSQAGGYVDGSGGMTGWLNELAFAPVDCGPCAAGDEWSGDVGCGSQYFSQDGVIRLAAPAGIPLENSLSPAEKLRVVQGLMANGDERAAAIYRSIGSALGHTIYLYSKFYDLGYILFMGRVLSGPGGALMVATAQQVLEEVYPALAAQIKLRLPDENSRRVGQSAAAAGLPIVTGA